MKKISIITLALLVTFALQAQTFITNDGIALWNTGTITATGDWQNEGTFFNDGVVILQDNWTNLGSYDAAGAGKIVLNFATTKSFNHNGQSVGTLSKYGVGNAQINGNVLVGDTLMLVSGHLLFPGGDTLQLGPGVQLQSSASSYVQAHVTHLGTGNVTFPIGNAQHYLPITLTQVTGAQPKATASLENFPGGSSAGAGIDSLINFPVAWRVTASAGTDTASYITLQFPQTLVTDPSLLVAAKQIGGGEFEGMGRRNVTTGGTVSLTSYSKGLRGLFSVAKGFGGNFVTDSLALVSFYNQTGGTNWTKDGNWLVGNVSSWQGVTRTGGDITALTLDAANINGEMNDEVADILSLTTVNVSNNNITRIPDFTALTALTSLNVSNNNLDFASLEYNVPLGAVINYSNQKVIGTAATQTVPVGNDHTVSSSVGGTQNTYVWKRAGVVVPGATSSSYLIPAINRQNMGAYHVEVSNTLVSNLTLTTAPTTVLAVAGLSGKLMMSGTEPASDGIVRLLRITEGTGYDTVQTVSVNATGGYLFADVVLDDYLVLGFADTLTTGQERALPTYYLSTLYWDEADTLFLNSSRSDLDIVSQLEPTEPLLDDGVIAGTVLEDDGLGGRGMGTKRVGGAGVSARRTQGTGRGKEILELVAYVYTNEQGEFSMTGLPAGDYRLNIQYPGYPMNEESDIDLTIGTSPLEEVVTVQATVAEGTITVRKLIVTGVLEDAAYLANVFPNPTVEEVRFEFEKTSESRELVLTDINGKSLKHQLAPELTGSMNVKDLPAGMYMLVVRDKNKVRKIVRVVIQ